MDKRFLDRLEKIFPDSFLAVKESFGFDRLPVVRVNTLCVEQSVGVSWLEEKGFIPRQILNKNAYSLQGRTKRELTDSDAYRAGWFYIQSPSSMLPVWCIDYEVATKINAGEDLQVLDMCAAPGSKSSQLAAVMLNKGEIVAFDVSRKRLYAMADNMALHHVSNVTVTLGSGTGVWRKYGPVFDVVMLDAPCSGEGRFSVIHSEEADNWDLKIVERLVKEQRRLLFSAAMSVKQGGILVYSTCTFAPEENEANIQFIMDTFDGSFTVERPALLDESSATFRPGLASWHSHVFAPYMSHTLRVKPDRIWEGFFVAVLRRN